VESDLHDLIRLAARFAHKLKLRSIRAEALAHRPAAAAKSCTAAAKTGNAAAAAVPPGARINGEGFFDDGCISDDSGDPEDFVVLPAPASIVKLRSACGAFSAAAVLKKALMRPGDALVAADAAPEDWVLLGQS
jgi:hypothetical protein